MKISFYFPPEYIATIHDGLVSEPETVPLHHSGHCGAVENWIYQSWVHLKQIGITSILSLEMPSQGIIFTLGSCLGKTGRTPAGMCLVDIVADSIPHSSAHAYIVQNRIQQKYIPNSFFIPHWPQPKMIPRSPDRGHRFENIAFFGDACNLAPELQQPEWQNHLRRTLGLSFRIQSPCEWHDYSEIDGVLGIRSFSQSRYLSKPATKLYNSWLAGVPFIGGRDVAYADEGNPGKNYLVATSPEEVLVCLRRLKEDVSLRDQLVANGHHQGAFYTEQKTKERWRLLVKETIAKFAHTHVRKTPRQHFLMFQQHRFFSWAYRQRERYSLF